MDRRVFPTLWNAHQIPELILFPSPHYEAFRNEENLVAIETSSKEQDYVARKNKQQRIREPQDIMVESLTKSVVESHNVQTLGKKTQT
jgi:hypothetical protein